MWQRLGIVAMTLGVLAACGSEDAATPAASPSPAPAATADAESAPATESTAGPSTDSERYPDVIAAEATTTDGITWRFAVTISSPYDSPERYAAAWRVLDTDGNELGVRVRAHDHANEQPFTRSLDGVEIPESVGIVVIEGRDLVNGWGGSTLEVALDR